MTDIVLYNKILREQLKLAVSCANQMKLAGIFFLTPFFCVIASRENLSVYDPLDPLSSEIFQGELTKPKGDENKRRQK